MDQVDRDRMDRDRFDVDSSADKIDVDRIRCPNHLRPPKIASGGTLTFNGLRPGGRICPSNLVRGDGIHYALTSYAIELRPPPPTYLRLRG